jgi:hypothetical protein
MYRFFHFLCLATCLVPNAVLADNESAVVAAVRFRDNLESIAEFSCSYHYAAGEVPRSTFDVEDYLSVEAAESVAASFPETARGIWVKRSGIEAQSTVVQRAPESLTHRISEYHYLTDGTLLLSLDSMMGAGKLDSEAPSIPMHSEVVPWTGLGMIGDSGSSDPFRYITAAVAVESIEFVDSRAIQTGSVQVQTQDGIIRRLIEFDPERGYLPVRNVIEIDNSNGAYRTDCRIIESKQLSNGSWFPVAGICFQYSGDSDVHIRTWLVDKLSESVKLDDLVIDQKGRYQVTASSSREDVVYAAVQRKLVMADVYEIKRELKKGGVRHITFSKDAGAVSSGRSVPVVMFLSLNIILIAFVFYYHFRSRKKKRVRMGKSQ